jgi:hypothetical protein
MESVTDTTISSAITVTTLVEFVPGTDTDLMVNVYNELTHRCELFAGVEFVGSWAIELESAPVADVDTATTMFRLLALTAENVLREFKVLPDEAELIRQVVDGRAQVEVWTAKKSGGPYLIQREVTIANASGIRSWWETVNQHDDKKTAIAIMEVLGGDDDFHDYRVISQAELDAEESEEE